MHEVPETRYAKSGEYHIAYQVVGSGPIDLVFIPGFVSNVEHGWDYPPLAHCLRRLASFARLILFDKRGTGMSDPVPPQQLPTLEQRMDDVRAVMDAAGSKRAALVGVSEGGPMSLLFAATYPDRTSAIVLMATFARVAWAPDYPFGTRPDVWEALLARMEKGWGTGVLLSAFAQSPASDAAARQWWARFQRQAASPALHRIDLPRSERGAESNQADRGQHTRFRTLESAFTAPSRRRARARRQWRRVPRVPAVRDRKEPSRFEVRPGSVRASRSQRSSERSG